MILYCFKFDRLILYCVVFYMQMVDLNFIFEIHHGGSFVWNPNLVYLGGSISIIDEVDPDKLIYFEIRDMCGELGAPSASKFHYLIPEVIWSKG